jgi:hypothetical protein
VAELCDDQIRRFDETRIVPPAEPVEEAAGSKQPA